MLIAVLNESRLSADDVDRMVLAVAIQVAEHVTPLWGKLAVAVLFYRDAGLIPKQTDLDVWKIVIFDHADQAGALGYHALGPDGKPYGRVFVDPTLACGGGILAPTSPGGGTVSAVLSHEVLETLVDQTANLWADGPEGAAWSMCALEICDPVESDLYEIALEDGFVTVSSFVTPEWFDMFAKAKFDYLGKLTAPFGMSPGGYMIVRDGDQSARQIFASYQGNELLAATKEHPAARTARRLAHKPRRVP